MAAANGLISTPVDRVQGTLHLRSFGGPRLAVEPGVQQPRKRAEQEVAGTTGGVDELGAREPEFVERGRERAIQDELLDELRGLQQGEPFLRVVGKVLVQVAQEAGVPLGVREVVTERARIRVDRSPEGQQIACRVPGDWVAPYRIVLAVVEPGHPG